ncbi:diaminopimelate decarboxylase [Streptomyces sp. ODS28]|uniref:diaminopimelate decarboxylase n=1 Tax=Streptomyces sp. ODS28 TaxID=3136688 RepID=UPI0031F05D11
MLETGSGGAAHGGDAGHPGTAQDDTTGAARRDELTGERDGLTVQHDERPGQRDELLGLFPANSRTLDTDGELLIAGLRAEELATAYGTPALIVDEAALRERARAYLDGLRSRWPLSDVAFASKAFPCTAMCRIAAEEGLSIDVAGGGEMAAALAAGADPATLVLHGNAKTPAEIAMAVRAGVGTVVVDNFDDIDRLEAAVRDAELDPSCEAPANGQGVLVRVIPGVHPGTHEAVATGQHDSKFGLPMEQAREAIARLRGSDRLRLDGVHVHVGSQVLSTEPFARAVEAVTELGEFAVYDLGGGLGVRYTYEEHPPTLDAYLDAVTEAARRHLPADARLLIEPGRSMVADAALTLYRVVTVKRGARTFVAVDGGMGDNLEPVVYQQRFEATVTNRVGGGETCELVGRHCESGDKIVSGVPLRDPRPGDLIAVPVTGAYSYSVASNYNGACRPPVVLCRDGEARLAVRRETHDDLLRRDVRWW